MKIICVYLCNYSDRNDYYISLMPYGITSIAAHLESQGFDVTLANLSSYGYKKAADLTLGINPDVAAVSIFSFNRSESFRYIRELKKRNPAITIIAGGQHPTFLCDEIAKRYPEIDHIITGEGEHAISSLLKNPGNSTRIITGDRITDINSLTAPSFFSGCTIGVNPNEQFRYIITSRGCPGNCTYCSSPSFWKRRVTMRSSENIMTELIHLRKKYGIIYFSIRDDNFTLNKKRVMEFCRMLEESRLFMMWNCQARVDTIDEEMLIAMKRAGLEHIQYGVESGSERILKTYDKSITREKIIRAAKITRDTGIYLSFYLMAGMHGETKSDVEATINLIKEALPHDSIVSPVAYYPGTAIYTNDLEKGLVTDSVWFTSADSGIYLHDPSETSGAIEKILRENNRSSAKAAYKPADIKKHRIKTGNDCWMNDIIEGDTWQNSGNLMKASNCYQRIIEMFPENIWGYLRLSECYENTAPVLSLNALKKASELVPGYYDAWYRLAHIYRITGDKKNALESAAESFRLNPMNTDVAHLYKKLKS